MNKYESRVFITLIIVILIIVMVESAGDISLMREQTKQECLKNINVCEKITKKEKSNE